MGARGTRGDVVVVEASHVTRAHNGRPVVNDVSMSVAAGQIFGLIGPSGSGKTTLVLMLMGLIKPTKGAVRVFGADPLRFTAEDRQLIGYMPQETFLYPTLTARENLAYVGGLFGMGWLKKRGIITRVLKDLGLWDARNKLAKDLSGGMLRRLHLATVLIHTPDLALIDEPMEGLDPLLRQNVWGILKKMKSHGQTVFMTTHNMEEAERCDNLALISEGRLVAAGTPAHLRERVLGGQIIRLKTPGFDARAYAALRPLPGIKEIDVKGRNEIILTVEDAAAVLPRVLEALKGAEVTVDSAEQYEPPFDEVFARLVLHD